MLRIDTPLNPSLLRADALALAGGLPEAELLRTDADGVTAIGLAYERGLEDLSLVLEAAVLSRLRALVEVVFARALEPYATRFAERLHAYWPQLEVHLHAHSATSDAPRASPFDVIWIERWGGSRRSCVYRGLSERALWRELDLKMNGKLLLQAACR